MILDKKPSIEISAQAQKEGMIPLRIQGVETERRVINLHANHVRRIFNLYEAHLQSAILCPHGVCAGGMKIYWTE